MKDKALLSNIPSSFVIELKIPKNYEIESIEQYEILEDSHGVKELEKFWTVRTDLVKNKVFHMVIINPTSRIIKEISKYIGGTILFGMIIVPAVIRKLKGLSLFKVV